MKSDYTNKLECKWGHKENFVINSKGYRECRVCQNEAHRRYRYKIRDGRRIYSELSDNNRFGGNREKVIQRDNESCVNCSMTRSEHKIMFDKDITVNHIDGNGVCRPKQERNNKLENLETLCLPCHTKKDHARNRVKSIHEV